MTFLCPTPRRIPWLAIVILLTCILCNSQDVAAQFNIALGKPIIDGSGAWDGGVVGQGAPFNGPFSGNAHPARFVTDGNTSEPNDGTISYWLGREQTLNEFITLDLRDIIEVDGIYLYNTHNRQYNDRGTDEFVIHGAFEVDGTNQLIDPFPILSGNLSDMTGFADIEPDFFPLPMPVPTRYLRFQALTSTYGNDNVGLNEIQVFCSSCVNPNKAFGKPVIDGSGAYEGGVIGEGAPFDGGQFPATNVTDGSVDDTGLWLGREGVANEYFTLDLEEVVNIQEVLLRNTHNRQFLDRGTREFRLLASQTVDGSNQLIDPVEILGGILPNSAGVSPLLETVFTADNGLSPTDARYLRFEALGATYFNDNVGLNEIEVFDEALHDPTPPPRDNIAYGKPVIDGSSSWDGEAFDGGSFPANRVTDGSIADANTGRNSYWLGSEYGENEYFTLDLGDVFTIEEIDLRNAHNTQYDDRGTDEFVIFGSTEVDEHNELVDPTVLVSGNLSNVAGQTPIEEDVFVEANGLNVSDVRYLKFQALTHFSSDTNGGAGLNEIEVYGRLAGLLSGDFNADGDFDTLDIDALVMEIVAGTNDTAFDLTNDGAVNGDDLTEWLSIGAAENGLASAYLEGDSNLDGTVNPQDLNALALSWQQSPNTWTGGDFDASGKADAGDLNLVGINWLGSVAPAAAAVPEPSATLLISVAGFLVFLVRRREWSAFCVIRP